MQHNHSSAGTRRTGPLDVSTANRIRHVNTFLVVLICIYCSSLHAKNNNTGFSYDRHIGFVISKNNKTLLIIENDNLIKGQKLLVLYQYKSQKLNLLEATVIGQFQTEIIELNSGLTFKTQPAVYEINKPNLEAVAFIPLSGISKYDLKNARIDLDGDGKNEQLHSCASQEGIHYIVRSGHARSGILRRDFYYYLGYDIEPSCRDSDFR